MLTNPNTLGLFDRNIEEIAKIVHGVGATLYYDGANLNAVMGISRPGDMGFDIVHFNLHKTFTQPHGGGGPGAGPIAVSDRIEPLLPRPQVVRARRRRTAAASPFFDLDYDRPKSIGRLRGFQGNFGVFVRSYAYICSLGGDGLKEASEIAVLNANYLKALLAEAGSPSTCRSPSTAPACTSSCCRAAGAKEKLGIKTLDIAKRLLDHGVHPPTVYFPLLVDEALMIEPTETETKETPRRLRRRDARDPRGGQGGPGDRPQRAVLDAGAAPGRGRRGEAAGRPLAPRGRESGRPAARRGSARERLGRDVASRHGFGPRRDGRCEEISPEELSLAARNHGLPLEALRHDITPAGLHYLLIHYDIPVVDPQRLPARGRGRGGAAADALAGRPARPRAPHPRRSRSSAPATGGRACRPGRSASPG